MSVSLQDVKDYIRVDGSADDALLTSLITAAEEELSGAGVKDTSSEQYLLAVRLLVQQFYDGNNNLNNAIERVVLQLKVPFSLIQNLTVTDVTTTTISLSWDRVTVDGGVLEYQIHRNGVQVGTSTTTTHTDTSLTASTTYNYQVFAVANISGVKFAKSVSVNSTTTE
jgi:hypothetical protein